MKPLQELISEMECSLRDYGAVIPEGVYQGIKQALTHLNTLNELEAVREQAQSELLSTLRAEIEVITREHHTEGGYFVWKDELLNLLNKP